MRDSNDQIAICRWHIAATSANTGGYLYLRLSAQMQTSLATQVETASFQYENWRVCCFHLVNSLKVELTHPAYSSIHDTFRW